MMNQLDFSFEKITGVGFFGVIAEINGILWIIGFILCAAIAYLLGSFNFGIIISKYKFREDIRARGSGNAGMTNMMRTYGNAAAGFTLFGDAMKAIIAALIGTILNGEMGAYAAGFFCILGHVYPLYFKFKGGKGVAATAALILFLNPVVFLVLLLMFVIILGFTKYLSLASIMCMLIYPFLLYRMSGQIGIIQLAFALAISVFVVFLHHENISRLLAGTENKFSFKKSKSLKNEDKKDKQ